MSFWVSTTIHLDECCAFDSGTRGNLGESSGWHFPGSQPQNSHLIAHYKSFLYTDVSKPFQTFLSVLKYVWYYSTNSRE